MKAPSYATATGNYRYRVQRRLFGAPRLIVQIEATWSYYDYGTTRARKGWRDAKLSDLQSVLSTVTVVHE